MSSEPLRRVLEATGFLPDGEPAPGVQIGEDARRTRRGRAFSPDALWRGPSALTVYFKFESSRPADEAVTAWRREIWNEGFAPLLWVICPDHIDLYNGFGRPEKSGDADKHRLQTFRNIDAELDELDAFAGRLVMETGQFWDQAHSVDRRTGVDEQLLLDLGALERDLVDANLDRAEAQALIGRSIFTQYLIDRQIVTPRRLKALCKYTSLPPILRDRGATGRLFGWLSDTFNGNMFPPSTASRIPQALHLQRVADFLEAVDETGQRNLFPYQFDVIPVELISSIYEQFAHAAGAPAPRRAKSTDAARLGVYYTRLPVVSLVLDEVMDGLSGKERVLDLTCGSGVFLVEALRRLVHLQSAGAAPSRALIRSTLYEQIYGVDISEAAIRVAAFSLYLAALELDPNPRPPRALKFAPLIGKTLFVGDARHVDRTPAGKKVLTTHEGLEKFDVIVGNPPWSFKGKAGTAARRRSGVNETPAQPRGEGLDFVLRATEFAHETTRFGMILSAMPFFSGSKTGAAASRYVVQRLSPVTLVNLSKLTPWLFPAAKMPAVALFARHRSQRRDQMTVVQVPWSSVGAKTHSFEISPSDITKLSLADWERHPERLKTAAFGRGRDLLLLENLTVSYEPLERRLAAFGSAVRDGLIRGNESGDASALRDLEILEVNGLRPFSVPKLLPKFGQDRAERPRSREIYRAPLLLVKEFLNELPRPITAVADRDLVFTDAYFGAALPPEHSAAAHLLAAILGSALAAWFFIMTASEFGLWKRRLLRQDVSLLPTPELQAAVRSDAGRRVLKLEFGFQGRGPDSDGLTALDEAVFDLYRLDAADRVVIRDGLFRASWEWKAGLHASVQPADVTHDLCAYTKTFLATIDGWLSARNRRHMRAEVFALPERNPLRIVRFVLEDQPGLSRTEILQPDGELSELLSRIGKRLNVKLTNSLVGARELRVHGADEVVIIKPAARRHWMGVSALEDADAVIAESVAGAAA